MDAAARPRSLFGQIAAFDPVFWICIFMELMERMAYYGVRLVVPVYMVLPVSAGGPGLSHVEKGTILAAWAAMQSWLPTFSGGFSDRYGYKRTLAVAVVLKTAGYLVMSQAHGFWPFLLGSQLLAAGTGVFKPGIQGTMAHSIARHPGSESMGWGLFYQSVNLGAFFGAYIPALTRDVWGWPAVFLACSGLVLFNAVPLLFYSDPKDERQSESDERSLGALVFESLKELFTSPVLLAFIFISAGFWFMFHQLFDMLPNFVDDWTDSSGLRASVGRLFGLQTWIQQGEAGVNIPQEQLLNINAFMIMTTMFVFAWLSSRVHALTSTILGMAVSSMALLFFLKTASVGIVLLGVVAFTVGEMLASPKRQEYMASLAPPGKRALYLGFANMPDGIGWVLGNLFAGAAYEEHGDKVNLARRFYAEKGSAGSVDAWLERARGGAVPQEALDELLKRGDEALQLADGATARDALAALDALPAEQAVGVLAEVLPRGEVLEHVVRAIPTLPDGSANSLLALRDHLFATYQPGQVWWTFIGTGAVSCALMIGYDRWVRKARKAA
jgi:dipeptide/tripeptide permease